MCSKIESSVFVSFDTAPSFNWCSRWRGAFSALVKCMFGPRNLDCTQKQEWQIKRCNTTEYVKIELMANTQTFVSERQEYLYKFLSWRQIGADSNVELWFSGCNSRTKFKIEEQSEGQYTIKTSNDTYVTKGQESRVELSSDVAAWKIQCL